MASISMADFRPHLPSDAPDGALGSQTLLGQPAQGVPHQGLPPRAAPQGAGATVRPAPADPAAEARRLEAQRKLLRQVLLIAAMLELLGGHCGAPLARRRRMRGAGRSRG